MCNWLSASNTFDLNKMTLLADKINLSDLFGRTGFLITQSRRSAIYYSFRPLIDFIHSILLLLQPLGSLFLFPPLHKVTNRASIHSSINNGITILIPNTPNKPPFSIILNQNKKKIVKRCQNSG